MREKYYIERRISMFVRSLMSKDVTYRKGGLSLIIKAGTSTYVDENKVSAKELKSLYGDRVVISTRDGIELAKDLPKPIFVKKEEKKPVVLNEDLIEDVIAQIEAEEKAKKEAEEKAKKLEEKIKAEEAKKKAEEEAKTKAEAEEKAKKELEAKVKVAEKAKSATKKSQPAKKRGRRKSVK